MSPQSLTQRNRIIEEHRQVILEMRRIEKEIEQLLREDDPRWKELEKERNALYVQIEPLIEKYWDWVPAVSLSCCPFCQRDLLRLFDPVDLRGFWWMDRTQRPRPQPPCCGHFCLLLGAVNTNGLLAKGGVFESRPGPDVPFVIPRILELPAMQAVVSSVVLHCGYTAFPVAYFAQTPPPGRALTQSWAQKEYRFVLEDGRSGWDIVEDNYEYDLAPWIKKRKIRWLDGPTLAPQEKDPQKCPFRHLKGAAKPQTFIGEE